MKTISIIISVLFLFSNLITTAQDWNVNPADFEFSMNVTGKVKLEGNYITDPDAKLGAFCEGECRGIASIDSNGDYPGVFFLTIYSNHVDGEVLVFHLMDGESNVDSLSNEIAFHSNAIVASGDYPFIWFDNEEYASTDFLSYSHPEQYSEADINYNDNQISLLVMPEVDLSACRPEFTLAPGAKAYVNDQFQVPGESELDFSSPLVYTVVGVDDQTREWTVSLDHDESYASDHISEDIVCYPNPAGNSIHIELPGESDLQSIALIDAYGKVLLLPQARDSEFVVDLVSLESGLYTLRFVFDDGAVLHKKLIKR
ncbi:MAG: T9SS type A sorting domain-containing protein [Bacteroidales bacterium]